MEIDFDQGPPRRTSRPPGLRPWLVRYLGRRLAYRRWVSRRPVVTARPLVWALLPIPRSPSPRHRGCSLHHAHDGGGREGKLSGLRPPGACRGLEQLPHCALSTESRNPQSATIGADERRAPSKGARSQDMVFIGAGAYGKAIVHRRLNSRSTMDTICSECNAPTSWDQGTGADTTPSRFHSSSRKNMGEDRGQNNEIEAALFVRKLVRCGFVDSLRAGLPSLAGNLSGQ
jgi:hypothetical protein